MASHLAPPTDRGRLVGALFVAIGVAVLTVGALGFGGDHAPDDEAPIDDTTDATVLGVVITQPPATTAGEVAPAAVPATFPTETTAEGRTSTRSVRPRSTTTTTVDVGIGTPTSITAPPTTAATTTSTTEAATTSTDTTLPPP